jgi:hypothetical protein
MKKIIATGLVMSLGLFVAGCQSETTADENDSVESVSPDDRSASPLGGSSDGEMTSVPS